MTNPALSPIAPSHATLEAMRCTTSVFVSSALHVELLNIQPFLKEDLGRFSEPVEKPYKIVVEAILQSPTPAALPRIAPGCVRQSDLLVNRMYPRTKDRRDVALPILRTLGDDTTLLTVRTLSGEVKETMVGEVLHGKH